jgi:hypothetical protein
MTRQIYHPEFSMLKLVMLSFGTAAYCYRRSQGIRRCGSLPVFFLPLSSPHSLYPPPDPDP